MSARRPTRSSEQRKKEYRKLLDQAEIIQEDEEIGLATAKVVDQIMKEANVLYKDARTKDRSKHTDEILLDAKLIATASSILYNVTDAVNVAFDSYDPIDFATRIRTTFLTVDDDPDTIQWNNLFERARKIMKFPPEFMYLYGTLGAEQAGMPIVQKEEKLRPKRHNLRNEQVAKKAPEKIASICKEEGSVDDTVKFLQWALNNEYEKNGGIPLNYFIFLIDPKNFTHSIENMFHLSFLVRDGRVKLHADENGILIISPVTSSQLKKAKNENKSYKQSIISIDFEEWKDVVKMFKIKDRFLDKWTSQWEAKNTKVKQ